MRRVDRIAVVGNTHRPVWWTVEVSRAGHRCRPPSMAKEGRVGVRVPFSFVFGQLISVFLSPHPPFVVVKDRRIGPPCACLALASCGVSCSPNESYPPPFGGERAHAIPAVMFS